MSLVDHRFLFASLDSKRPASCRKVHIRRLYDILQLSLQRNDIPRAKTAWAILIRCREIDWKSMWTTGLLLLGEDVNGLETNPEKLEFLRAMMLQHPGERESIIKEIILRLILAGKHREALDELELYLPAFPYQDNPVLHIYAGFISLHLAQPPADNGSHGLNNGEVTATRSFDPNLFRDAQAHFERAQNLDSTNIVATALLNKLPNIAQGYIKTSTLSVDHDTDEETMDLGDSPRLPRKRIRT